MKLPCTILVIKSRLTPCYLATICKYFSFLSVAPVSVEISNKGDQMVVGRQSEIVCRSSGSRPPAHITWYLGGVRIEGGTESVSLRLRQTH